MIIELKDRYGIILRIGADTVRKYELVRLLFDPCYGSKIISFINGPDIRDIQKLIDFLGYGEIYSMRNLKFWDSLALQWLPAFDLDDIFIRRTKEYTEFLEREKIWVPNQ